VAATVRRLEPLGNESLVHLDGPGGRPWVVRAPADVTCAPGECTGVRLDRRRVHLFAGDDGTRLATGALA
jgi:hypothetical protein